MGGDTIVLRDTTNTLVENVSYGSLGNRDQSLVRPNISQVFVLHTDLSQEKFSPGYGLEDLSKVKAVPEPKTIFLCLIGGVLGALWGSLGVLRGV